MFDNADIGSKQVSKDIVFSATPENPPLPLDIYSDREENVFKGESIEMEVAQSWKNIYTCAFHFIHYPFDEHHCEFIVRIAYPHDRKVVLRGNPNQIKMAKTFVEDIVRSLINERQLLGNHKQQPLFLTGQCVGLENIRHFRNILEIFRYKKGLSYLKGKTKMLFKLH